MALHLVEIFSTNDTGGEYRVAMQIFDYQELLSPERIKALLDKAGMYEPSRIKITRE